MDDGPLNITLVRTGIMEMETEVSVLLGSRHLGDWKDGGRLSLLWNCGSGK